MERSSEAIIQLHEFRYYYLWEIARCRPHEAYVCLDVDSESVILVKTSIFNFLKNSDSAITSKRAAIEVFWEI